ncbi:hypothetical protein OKW39_003780 [Paraburkholderia sp. MM6662-R1]
MLALLWHLECLIDFQNGTGIKVMNYMHRNEMIVKAELCRSTKLNGLLCYYAITTGEQFVDLLESRIGLAERVFGGFSLAVVTTTLRHGCVW